MIPAPSDVIKPILWLLFWIATVAVVGGLACAAIKPQAHKAVRASVAAVLALLAGLAWIVVSLHPKSVDVAPAGEATGTPTNTEVFDYSKQRAAEARQLFNSHCANAGEKVARRVSNVEGVVWIRWRKLRVNTSSQFDFEDPYGHDCSGEECIKSLLRATEGAAADPDHGLPPHKGYRYVESEDPVSGQKYRYTLALNRSPEAPHLAEPKMTKTPIEQFTARYGVTWVDVSTPEDRKSWIAGESLRVLDLKTGDLIGERVGYLMDSAQGSRAGGRQPWIFALDNACPAFALSKDRSSHYRTHRETPEFITGVLIPEAGDK